MIIEVDMMIMMITILLHLFLELLVLFLMLSWTCVSFETTPEKGFNMETSLGDLLETNLGAILGDLLEDGRLLVTIGPKRTRSTGFGKNTLEIS